MKPRPKWFPQRIPKWAWRLDAWLSKPADQRGRRPTSAPKKVPAWFWAWRLWRRGKQIPKRLIPKKPAAFVDVQGCPVPGDLASAIVPSLNATGATLMSCYRGSDPAGARILQAHGKHTQAQLYAGYMRHLPGYLPANRPGTSTHELRSDGIAYPGPVGRRLEGWQCGMDIDDAHVNSFIRHLAGRGITAHRPYGFGAEYHHVNLTRRP